MSVESINKALALAQLRATRSLPASLVPVLKEIGILRAQRGKPIEISLEESLRLRSRVVQLHALPADVLKNPGFRLAGGGSRIILARQAGNEKMSRFGVTASRPTVPEGCVIIRDQVSPGYEIIPAHQAVARVKEGLILVENWQAFEFFEDLVFPVPHEWMSYPVLYRGDPEAKQDICEAVIRVTRGEVIVFPDYDPAGLVNALAVPRMSRILWPGRVALEAALPLAAISDEKYLRQVHAASAILSACTHPDVSAIWQIIRARGRVPAQEFFFEHGEEAGRRRTRPRPN